MKLKNVKPLELFKFKNAPGRIFVTFVPYMSKEYYKRNNVTIEFNQNDILIREFIVEPSKTRGLVSHAYTVDTTDRFYGYMNDKYESLLQTKPGWNHRVDEFLENFLAHPNDNVTLVNRKEPLEINSILTVIMK